MAKTQNGKGKVQNPKPVAKQATAASAAKGAKKAITLEGKHAIECLNIAASTSQDIKDVVADYFEMLDGTPNVDQKAFLKMIEKERPAWEEAQKERATKAPKKGKAPAAAKAPKGPDGVALVKTLMKKHRDALGDAAKELTAKPKDKSWIGIKITANGAMEANGDGIGYAPVLDLGTLAKEYAGDKYAALTFNLGSPTEPKFGVVVLKANDAVLDGLSALNISNIPFVV